MSIERSDVSVLGGGPAGVAAAYYLKSRNIPYSLYEAAAELGGNCRTYQWDDYRFDYGAHRLHDKEPEFTALVKELLGDELVEIHVPSQIYSEGKWVDFPLSPLNLIKNIGVGRFFREGTKLVFKSKTEEADNFTDDAINKYGKYISERFLLNYTAKLWGVSPKELHPEVTGGRLKGLNVRTFLFETLFGAKKKTKHLDGGFYYPKNGFGQIMEAFSRELDLSSYLNHAVTSVSIEKNKITEVIAGDKNVFNPMHVINTLPINKFIEISNGLSDEVYSMGKQLTFRNIKLMLVKIDKPSLTNNASIYFPENKYEFTRIVEPRNRSSFMSPPSKTSLAIEIPYTNDLDLNDRKILDQVIKTGLIEEKDVLEYRIFDIKDAYPVLTKHNQEIINKIFLQLGKIENLSCIGRAGMARYTHLHDHFKEAKVLIDKNKVYWSKFL